MGIFKKKKDDNVPELPELPKLPELNFNKFQDYNKNSEDFLKFPSIEEYENPIMPKLPSFPTTTGGEKFSQTIIKNAVKGDSDFIRSEDTPEMPEVQMNLEPPKKELYEEHIIKPITQEENKGPIFVRIDKFEEGLKYIRQSKEKLKEIQDLLSETRELKKKESIELDEWEENLRNLKSKLEKIEKEFSSKF